jgi:hypothetical protein
VKTERLTTAPYPLPGFSDPVSSWTHLAGAGAFACLAPSLLRRGRGDGARLAFLGVFTFSTVFLLSMSGVYHLLSPGGAGRAVLRRLDHGAIFMLIAGTFTPLHWKFVAQFAAAEAVRTACQRKREQSPGGYVPEHERALAVLAGVVRRKGGERRDRQHAAEALGRIGPGARPAFRALAEVVADESEGRLVRGSAWWALQRVAPKEAEKLKAP